MTKSTKNQPHVTAYAAAAAGNGDVSDCVLRVRVRHASAAAAHKHFPVGFWCLRIVVHEHVCAWKDDLSGSYGGALLHIR